MSRRMKITLLGATGRLGSAIGRAILDAPDMELAGAVVRLGSAAAGQDIGAWLGGEPIGRRADVTLEDALGEADVVIDASLPAMTVAAAEYLAERNGTPLVSGVTGFDAEQAARLDAVSRRVPLLTADNFSLGVAIAEALVRHAARLPAEDWDIEIEESHHRMKADAPSGTALMLGRAAAETRGERLEEVASWARHGHTGPRKPGTIGFAVTRGGAIVGEHAVRLVAEMEEIAITHRAFDRAIFARGALAAARWIDNGGQARPAGHYSMQDVVAG
ncbi:4-hydroxy-tetrahydrodipicolinate reductase [Maricaulis sp.]|uniref:4-hydroxy-tetrahydrodipicolinate reductase n=1 Tax=Maricaulis sp. TaxID=1486257 RepID=UPI00262BF1C2|nr:4-hydroxy-tetrahydrodipicolinate reductase [Maricaulis sp.]